MSLTEESRYRPFQGLPETLGPDKAATLMDLLPPVGWADVATKRDLDHLRDTLRSDMATLGTELRSDMATLGTELRSDMATLGTELRNDMATLGTELRSEMATLGGGFHGEIEKSRAEFFREQRNQAIAIIGANATITGLLLAAFHLM